MNEFSKRLRLIREERNQSLADAAKILDTTKSTLSRYENGKVDPSINVAIEYAKRLGVSVDWLAGVSDINNRDNDMIREERRLSRYYKAFEKIEKSKISPEKLEKLIDVMKE